MSFLKKHASTIGIALIFVLGVCVLAYPFVSDFVNSRHQTKAVVSYAQAVQAMSDEERQEYFNQARVYNEELAADGLGYASLSDAERERYESLLNVGDGGAMGCITIPCIGVELPIYHGTSDGTLQMGIGHLEGSSLPIGGETTHSVLVGHRGLPTSTLFTNLDELREGDLFMVSVLEQEAWYEVDQILTVEPDDVSALAMEEGADYCTLLTCTPYGVNSHRLLVRGHRTDPPAIAPAMERGSVMLPLAILLIAAMVVVAAALGMRAWLRRRRYQQMLSRYQMSDAFRTAHPESFGNGWAEPGDY